MGIRGRQYTPMDEPVFNKAIPGTEALAGALKDTFGAFRIVIVPFLENRYLDTLV